MKLDVVGNTKRRVKALTLNHSTSWCRTSADGRSRFPKRMQSRNAREARYHLMGIHLDCGLVWHRIGLSSPGGITCGRMPIDSFERGNTHERVAINKANMPRDKSICEQPMDWKSLLNPKRLRKRGEACLLPSASLQGDSEAGVEHTRKAINADSIDDIFRLSEFCTSNWIVYCSCRNTIHKAQSMKPYHRFRVDGEADFRSA
jgi:hypothetical protein